MRLRKILEKDADGMLAWMHSPLSAKVFAKDFNHYTKVDVLNFIQHAAQNNTELHYACVDENDNYLGTVSLKNIDKTNKHAEFAISFLEKSHGTGASTFATIELLRKAFFELDLNKVYLNVLSCNQRAISFYEKIGFQKEGIFKNHIKKNETYCDLVWYAIEYDAFNLKYNSPTRKDK